MAHYQILGVFGLQVITHSGDSSEGMESIAIWKNVLVKTLDGTNWKKIILYLALAPSLKTG